MTPGAAGMNGRIDEPMIRRAFDLFQLHGEVHEIRIPGTRKGTISGYVSTDLGKMIGELNHWVEGAPGVYITLNPALPDLLNRAPNCLVPYAKATTGDREIIRLKCLVLDFDPVRPAGISSSDEEHELALSEARRARDLLVEEGWPLAVLADSGNGAHLIFYIDLPNDDTGRALLKAALDGLAARFSTERISVDRTMGNPARIVKLYGTWARKGFSSPERPHRMSRILEAGSSEVVIPEQLQQAGATAEKPAPARANGKKPTALRAAAFDLGKWIIEHPIDVAREIPWNGGGRRFVLNACVFNSEHVKGSAAICQSGDGVISYKCQHNSCADKHWEDVRRRFEPNWHPYQPGSNGHQKVNAVAAVSTVPAAAAPVAAESAVRADMPFDVLDGRLGEIYTRRLSELPIAYAWVALLVGAGAMLPRHEDLFTKALRPNLFWCPVGPTDSGKSQAIARAFSVLGVPGDLVMEAKYGSAEGLLGVIDKEKRTRALLSPDELAHLLGKCDIQRSSFPFVLNTAFYQDKQQGGTKEKSFEINCRISIAGGVVEEQFADVFGQATMGGLYDRFLFGLCPSPFQYLYRPLQGEAEDNIQPCLLPSVAPDVWDARDAWVKKEGIRPRLAEIALRCAYICAAIDGRPKLIASDLGPAHALAKYQTHLRALLAPNPGENPDAKCAIKIRAWLSDRANDGAWCSKRELHRGITAERYGPTTFMRCLNAMQFNGEVELDKSGRNVRALCE